MKNKVESILQQLISLPLWSIGRGGDFLVWFAFGNERREVTRRNGEKKIVSDFSLHVQCAWRLRYKTKIILASGDNFSEDDHRHGQFENSVKEFFSIENPLSKDITAVTADEIGNITLTLKGEYYLDIFPDTSADVEYWRIFRPSSEDPHYVFTSEGIILE